MTAKNNILLLFLSPILLFAVSPCSAQNPPAPKKDADATLIMQVGSAAAFYFARANVIKGNAFFYALGSVEDIGQEKDVISMTFSFQIPGQTLTKPESISLSMTARSRNTTYANNRKLRLFADGKRVFDAEMELTRPRREGAVYGVEVFELKSIKFKDFGKFAKAKKLSVEFGPTKIVLGVEQQKRVQDFYRLFQD